MDCRNECFNLYCQKFGKEPEWLVRCPGRVNLIGEHIDYSDYSVLPMAIEDSTWLAVGTCPERKVLLENVDTKYPPFTLDIGITFSNATASGGSPKWHHYFLAGWRGILERLVAEQGGGEADALAQANGMCAVVGSRIPPSAGLSSSSALVCAAALATICVQTGQTFEKISRKELAEIATKSERFVGMEGGGMDQACECLAQRGSALRIDFAPSLHWEFVQLPRNALFAVLHSKKECNKGSTSYYNQRVVECRIAAQIIAKKSGKSKAEWHTVRTLRDAASLLGLDDCPGDMLKAVEQYLAKGNDDDDAYSYSREEVCKILNCTDSELAKHSLNSNTQNLQKFWLQKRAKHVFSEAARVLEFERVCKSMDGREALENLAALMNASHQSCAELFECSCPELDMTVEKCLESGCLGARLTGAGWGGCAVALVDATEKVKVEKSGLEVLFWSEPCEGIEAFRRGLPH